MHVVVCGPSISFTLHDRVICSTIVAKRSLVHTFLCSGPCWYSCLIRIITARVSKCICVYSSWCLNAILTDHLHIISLMPKSFTRSFFFWARLRASCLFFARVAMSTFLNIFISLHDSFFCGSSGCIKILKLLSVLSAYNFYVYFCLRVFA